MSRTIYLLALVLLTSHTLAFACNEVYHIQGLSRTFNLPAPYSQNGVPCGPRCASNCQFAARNLQTTITTNGTYIESAGSNTRILKVLLNARWELQETTGVFSEPTGTVQVINCELDMIIGEETGENNILPKNCSTTQNVHNQLFVKGRISAACDSWLWDEFTIYSSLQITTTSGGTTTTCFSTYTDGQLISSGPQQAAPLTSGHTCNHGQCESIIPNPSAKESNSPSLPPSTASFVQVTMASLLMALIAL